jgi:serine/threonine protein kinase/WD40 repeat protein
MALLFQCTEGHRWRADGDGDRHCPWCGALGEPRGANAEAVTLDPIMPSPVRASEPATIGDGGAPPAEAALDLPLVPGYELLGELGRGGMGIVYKARQLNLNRLVALKMVLAGVQANSRDLVRFLAEAEAVARLDHPNIVHIHEIGKHAGLPFLSLEYIPGENLAQQLTGTPRPPAESAQLIEPLARAVHYAHEHGIIHRDLKPSNILLQIADLRLQIADLKADGKSASCNLQSSIPKITDFGLAKRLEGGSGVTTTGAIVGTPSYMAPEQAEGKKQVGPATDTYALGAILYELLTGRPPFRATTPLDTVLQLLNDEPVPPRQLQSKVPRDLETICLKCLQKEPRKRYPTAEALADDLRRFLSDQPIVARPVGRLERFGRWCRRNPVVASLLAVVAVGIGVAALLLNQERTETLHNLARAEEAEHDLRAQLDRTATAEREKTDKLWQSYLDQARAGRFSRQMGQRFDSLDALSKAAHIRPDPRLRDEAIAALALPDLRPGAPRNLWPEGTAHLVFDDAYRRYARADDRGNISIRDLADDREVRSIPTGGRTVGSLALSPDGGFLVAHLSGQLGDVVRVWTVASGQVLVTEPMQNGGWGYSADGHTLALAPSRQAIHLLDLTTGKEIRRLHLGGQPWQTLALRPDGRQLALGYQGGETGARIYDVASGKEVTALPSGNVWCAAWHPDGHRLALGCADARVYLWDVPRHRLVATLEGHAQDVVSVAFHPSGALVATQSWDGTTRLWDVATGRPLLLRAGTYYDARFSQDGRLLGYLREGSAVRLMEVAARPEYATLVSYLGAGEGEYRYLNVHPDGRLLAVGMDDGVHLWDLARGREITDGLPGQTNTVHFRPDGQGLLTCGNSLLRHWPIHTEERAPHGLHIGPPRTSALHTFPHGATPSADGRTGAVASEIQGVASIVDLERGTDQGPDLPHPSLNTAVLSPNGRWVVTVGWHSTEIKVWDVTTRQVVRELPPEGGTGIVFSPDGQLLVNCRGDEYVFWDVATWHVQRHLRRTQKGYSGPAAFTADGRILAVSLSPGTVNLVRVADGQILASLEDPNQDRTTSLCFTPDGARLICQASATKVVHIWDLRAIRARLAALDLDWEAGPLPPPAWGPNVAPLRVQVDPGTPDAAPSPVVTWMPSAKRRAATPAQLATWVEQLGDARKQPEAARALEAAGPPALPALARSKESEARRITDRIVLGEVLEPTRVGLKLKEARIEDAVAALSQQGGIPLVYRSPPRRLLGSPLKKVTVDLEGVPFWEALDRLCEAAGLTFTLSYSVNGPVLQLTEGTPLPRGRIAYLGPLRLQMDQLTYQRALSLRGHGGVPSEKLIFTVTQLGEPTPAIRQTYWPRGTEAEDDAGRSYRGGLSQLQSFSSFGPGVYQAPMSFSVQAPAQRGSQLKNLKGILPLDVMVRRRVLVRVDDVARAQGKVVQAASGFRLAIQDLQQVGQLAVTVTLTGPAAWSYDMNRQGFELVDNRGHRYPTFSPWLNPQPRRHVDPADVAALTTAWGTGFPANFPWVALTGAGRKGSQEWTGQLFFASSGSLSGPLQLVFFSFDQLRTELPFEFHDLPLP